MKTEDSDSPVVVFAGTTLNAGMIKSMLEEEGIQAFIQNELMSSIAPWQIELGGLGAAKVLVASTNYEEATELINSFGLNNQDG
jgi:hypothetical protein